LWMDFRICNQQTAEKENFGVHQVLQNGEPPNVVSILKTSQRTNLPLEKKLTKVSFKNSPVQHTICRSPDLAHDWQAIRQLDEEENWTERTEVVTKEDHELYIETAREWLDSLIADLPSFREQKEIMTTNSDFPELPPEELPAGSGVNDTPSGVVNSDDLDSSLMSGFSNLQIGNGDCPQTFSPIGSGRTSPEQDNLMDSNEDIDKLLVHDEVTETSVLQNDVLSTGNERADNLLKEITSEDHPYKSAGLFAVDPTDLEKEFQEDNIGDEVFSGEKSAEVEDMFERNAGNQLEENDQFGDNEFKPATEAMWELDYLEKCGSNNPDFKESALARQSLYVKFDPLVKGGSPLSPATRNNRIGMRDVLPSKPLNMGDNLLLMDSPGPRAKASNLASRQAPQEQTPAEAASPCVVDKLLNFSPSKYSELMQKESAKKEEPIAEETSISESQTSPGTNKIELSEEEPPREKAPSKSKEDFDEAVKKEIEALRKQALFFNKEELNAAVKRETDMLRQQMKEESAIRDMESKELTERNEQLTRETGELRVVMQEYEKTIADMIEKGQKSQDQYNHSTSEVVKERDQLQADLTAVETAFSDLHRRYEKLKGVVENFKKNEETLKKATSDYQEKLKRSEEKYRLLKKHAEEKIESANIEIARVRKSNESEIAVMKAALKKEQTKTASLEMSLQQKVSENAELTAICDELINKMGGNR